MGRMTGRGGKGKDDWKAKRGFGRMTGRGLKVHKREKFLVSDFEFFTIL